MISLAQVVAAMALGALLSVTVLLPVELRRPSRSDGADGPGVAPPEPDRVVDDDAQGTANEVLAQLAATQFELLGEDHGPAQLHPEAHLTLIPTARGPRHTAGVSAAKKRSSHSQCPPGCVAGHPEVLRWPPQSASRD